VNQQLAAIRMLFDWLITGQVVPINPAAAVRGPKHVVKTGKTPVLEAPERRKLIDSILAVTVQDLRDRALTATLAYSVARITAVLTMKVDDLRPKGAGCARKAASTTSCRATTRYRRRGAPISRPPGSLRIARDGFSAPHVDILASSCPTRRRCNKMWPAASFWHDRGHGQGSNCAMAQPEMPILVLFYSEGGTHLFANPGCPGIAQRCVRFQ
jgi:integrase